MLKTTAAASMLALTTLGLQWDGPPSRPPQPVQPQQAGQALKEERMILEYNATLDEAVLRVEAESEEVLDHVQVTKPSGERLFALQASSGTERGLSSFKIELQEGSLAGILATFTEGDYQIHGQTVRGLLAHGSAELSLALPGAPRLVYPYSGAVNVPTSRLVVRWVAERGVSGYRIQLEQGENDGLVVQLPPGQDSLQVPDGFLMRGTETQLEIAAIGPNGNRTVAEVVFTTR